MTELLDLFTKIVEYYGQTVATIIVVIVVIMSGVFFLLKNYSSIVIKFLENRWKEKEDKHTSAAKHRKNITPKIRCELSQLAQEIKADRILVFEFSNGSSNLVGLPFLYMSATCEVVTAGTVAVSVQYQKINTAIVAEFLENLDERGYYYAKNIEECKETCPVLYSFMKPNDVHSALFYSLYGVDDTIGFMVATTIKNREFSREVSLPRVAGTAQIISSLLNFDKLHDKL